MNQPDDTAPRPVAPGSPGDEPADWRGGESTGLSDAPTRLERAAGATESQPAHDSQRLLAGRYRLDELLGRGSMGAVWKAHDVVLRRSVAVKEVLLPATQSEEENAVSRERALREARAIAALSHPNVVTLFDVVEDDGRPWVVMELVPARSLAAIIKEDGPLPPVEAARIGVAVLAALDSAHEVGITHRDVKPGNILVSGDGRVKLADFGISRKIDESQLTQTGLMIGSPSYIAPEVARGREAGRAADIWGLGATLHCAVEGEPPFDLGDAVATLTAVVGQPPQPAPHAGPLAGILRRCLDKDPRTRIRSDELRQALQSVASSRPLPPAVPARTQPVVPTSSAVRPVPSRPPVPTGPPTGGYPPPARPMTGPPGQPGGYPAYAGPPPPATAPHPAPVQAHPVDDSERTGRGWVIALSLALVVVIVAGALWLLLGEDDSGSGASGETDSTTTTATTQGPTAPTTPEPTTEAPPTSSDATIDGTTATGAVKIKGQFHGFSFTLPEGWEIAKAEDDRTEFVEAAGASDASMIKVTVVAEPLTAASVHDQIDGQRAQVGSPARLADFHEVDYKQTTSGAVLWQYTNTSQAGSDRRGYFYAFEGPGEILWKVILFGPVGDQQKLLGIINPLVASIKTT